MKNQYHLSTDRQENMDKYMLLKDIPGVKAGAIFVHDKEDKIYGSIAEGCLKLAWDNGNCQRQTVNEYCAGLCAETIIFHANVIKDKTWFKKVSSVSDFKEIMIEKLEDLISLLKKS